MSLMRSIVVIAVSCLVVLSGYWMWGNLPDLRGRLQDLLHIGKFQTLEVRHTAESIMESHRRELLADSEHTFLEPKLKFYPYLLMEVKYARTQERTGEGVILWSLVDGEMVINTNTWEKTHGFLDCLSYGADRNDFKVINALSNRGGIMDREGLTRLLNVENEKLDVWIDSCRKKNLIVQNGNNYRLHLQNPKLLVIPETKLDQWLVTKPSKNAPRVPKRYRSTQIETIARSAFGNDFAVRKKTEVFLPVYSIIVQNPDGSQMTTYWNALNGKRIEHPYVLE
jgi:hypothetical protein